MIRFTETDAHDKMFCQEALVWRQLRHPNLVPFRGLDEFAWRRAKVLGMVTDWMPHGNIKEFVQSVFYSPQDHRGGLVRAGLLILIEDC
jgi:hypothetical protein